MSITGAHVLLYTPEAKAVREIFRDVFGFRHVDAHDGWLIFALPPAELGVHPSMAEGQTHHEFSLMCDDIEKTVAELREKGIRFEAEPQDAGYGIYTMMVLPGGVKVQLYEPRHKSPLDLP